MISTVFAALGEMEREYIKSRQREGIDAAKKRGKRFGRPTSIHIDERFISMLADVREGKISAVMAMRKLGISKASWYRLVSRNDEMLKGEKGSPQ